MHLHISLLRSLSEALLQECPAARLQFFQTYFSELTRSYKVTGEQLLSYCPGLVFKCLCSSQFWVR